MQGRYSNIDDQKIHGILSRFSCFSQTAVSICITARFHFSFCSKSSNLYFFHGFASNLRSADYDFLQLVCNFFFSVSFCHLSRKITD